MAQRKSKFQNTEMVQTYIRVRPLGSHEEKSPLLEVGTNEVIIKIEGGRIPKTLTFDKVFNEDASQIAVYNTVVRPMVREVLQGYNCTIFAYGQTGTGKTYTMMGELEAFGERNINAGIIPRALVDVFHQVKSLNCEYQVKISYLELYNEKMRSLLQSCDDEFNIQLLEDIDGNIFLKGQNPKTVTSKDEALQLLKVGMEKKKIASTNMNINSSRSHTILTITVRVTESQEGDRMGDRVRIGKLHLVDLAGSENVFKSGTGKKTLNETSNINRSLLTLGRVITSLTENSSHIPYRESKLTRFLKDSLGGNTKTCIVGTISSAESCFDETENTLSYANKARLIKNKPIKNKKVRAGMDKIQMTVENLLVLERDLKAAKFQEGIFIPKESYAEITSKSKMLSQRLQAAKERNKAIKEKYRNNMEILSGSKADFNDKCADFEELQETTEYKRKMFEEEKNKYLNKKRVQDILLEKYIENESKLTEQAKTSKTVLENLLNSSIALHDKVDRKKTIELDDSKALEQFKEKFIIKLVNERHRMQSFCEKINENYDKLTNGARNVGSITQEKTQLFVEGLIKIQQILAEHNEDSASRTAYLMNKNIENLRHTLTHIECVVNSEQNPKADIKCHIQCELNSMKDMFMLLKNTAQDSQHTLTEHHEKRKLLSKELDLNFHKSNKAILEIQNELQSHIENAEAALENVHEVRNKAKLAVQKAKVLGVAAADVESCAKEVEISIQPPTFKTFESLDNIIQLYLKSHKETKDNIIGKILKEAELIMKIRTDFGNQLGEQRNKILEECEHALRRMKASTKKSLETVINPFAAAEEIAETAVTEIIRYTDHQQCHNEKLILDFKKFINDTADEMNNYKHICQEALKVDPTSNSAQVVELVTYEKNIANSLADIKRDVELLSCISYIPTGMTPKRVPRIEVDYPKQLVATDPGTFGVQLNSRLPLSTAIPQHGVVSRSTFSVECTVGDNNPENQSLRKSLSMPNIGEPTIMDIGPTTSTSTTRDIKKRPRIGITKRKILTKIR